MKIRTSITIIVTLLITIVVAFATTVGEEENSDRKKAYLYQWTDEKGTVHITDDLDQVPKKYREKARRVETRKREKTGQPPEMQGGTYVPSEPEQERDEETRKAEWQHRLREWKDRLADGENRYRELNQERTNLIGRWGVLAYAPPETRVEYERISKEMEEVKKEIENARHMIDVAIPEEARKAGIPPGWLRE